ncbi:hypothetical protein F5Y17DRAFT_20177 [Xylariaceae sp. FL0594]|nr:hypothetical protein F5Y17DRAFT_20177 [Xylariaceae sp. FL0594]
MTTFYDFTFPTVANILKSEQHLLDVAETLAKEKDIPVSELLDARVAPDMWPLSQQITISCMHAKNAVEKLGGGKVEKEFPFGPASLEDCKSLLAEALKAVESVKAEDANARTAEVVGAYMGAAGELPMVAVDYATGYLLPNLYFHATTVYDILRGKGASIGKRDFIAPHLKFVK